MEIEKKFFSIISFQKFLIFHMYVFSENAQCFVGAFLQSFKLKTNFKIMIKRSLIPPFKIYLCILLQTHYYVIDFVQKSIKFLQQELIKVPQTVLYRLYIFIYLCVCVCVCVCVYVYVCVCMCV